MTSRYPRVIETNATARGDLLTLFTWQSAGREIVGHRNDSQCLRVRMHLLALALTADHRETVRVNLEPTL